jgi:hypothetical protein
MFENNEILIQEINELKQKINDLEIKLAETQQHLKKYTAPSRNKKYYESHKEIIKQKIKDPSKNLFIVTPEKKKEYNRIAYLNRKNKANDLAE